MSEEVATPATNGFSMNDAQKRTAILSHHHLEDSASDAVVLKPRQYLSHVSVHFASRLAHGIQDIGNGRPDTPLQI